MLHINLLYRKQSRFHLPEHFTLLHVEQYKDNFHCWLCKYILMMIMHIFLMSQYFINVLVLLLHLLVMEVVVQSMLGTGWCRVEVSRTKLF